MKPSVAVESNLCKCKHTQMEKHMTLRYSHHSHFSMNHPHFGTTILMRKETRWRVLGNAERTWELKRQKWRWGICVNREKSELKARWLVPVPCPFLIEFPLCTELALIWTRPQFPQHLHLPVSQDWSGEKQVRPLSLRQIVYELRNLQGVVGHEDSADQGSSSGLAGTHSVAPGKVTPLYTVALKMPM